MQNTTNNVQSGKSGTKRIEYIDALRGFTMFLVVFSHVASTCLHCLPISATSVHYFFAQVRMPMFFLISGFVLYKHDVAWNSKQIISFFQKKIPVQLFSPLLFFVVFLHVKGISLIDGLFNDSKYGFWFTYVLFIYYVIYVSIRFLIKSKWADIFLISIGICLLPFGWPQLQNYIPLPKALLSFLSIEHWKFFLFFVFGTLLKKYFDMVQKCLDGKWLIPACIVIYFLGNAFRDLMPIHKFIRAIPLTLSGLVILFTFFRNNNALFSQNTVLGLVSQYIGRRTLDIYLIHHFLLPKNLSFVTVFADYPMPIIETTVSALLAIIIIAACLLISNVIRLSPFLAHWLFGVKRAS